MSALAASAVAFAAWLLLVCLVLAVVRTARLADDTSAGAEPELGARDGAA